MGIDLGTTNSAVGLWLNGRVEMLQNPDDGKVTTPSVVGYKQKGDILVGNPAIKAAMRNLPNTIYDAKRMLGRRYDDPRIT